MKRYLICSRDESVIYWKPQAIFAVSGVDALQRYLRVAYSKDSTFREGILDLCVNMTFVERFYLSTDHEQERFDKTGVIGTESEIVKSRVKVYFASRPEFGERFLRYMETEDKSLIDDDIFEFIAVNESEDQHGFVAIDPDLFELVA